MLNSCFQCVVRLSLVLDCVEGVAESWIGGNSGARCIQFTANKKKKKSRISIRRYRYSTDTKNKRWDWIECWLTHGGMERYVWNECAGMRHTCDMQQANERDPKQRETQPKIHLYLSLPQTDWLSRCRILIRFAAWHRISRDRRSHSANPENRNGTPKRKNGMKWNVAVAVASSRCLCLCLCPCMPSGNLGIKCPNVVVFHINCLYN